MRNLKWCFLALILIVGSVSCRYEIKVEEVMISPSLDGTFDESQEVHLYCGTLGATIYYTLDETVPTIYSLKYVQGEPIVLNATTTVTAIANNQNILSPVAKVTFTQKPIAITPIMTPNGGEFDFKNDIVFASDTEEATFYYTFSREGFPSLSGTGSTINFEQVGVTVNCNLSVYAMKEGYRNSEIITADFIPVTSIVAPRITFDEDQLAKEFDFSKLITFTSETPNLLFHYTTNGDIPTAETANVADSINLYELGLNGTCILQVVAINEENLASSVSTLEFIQAKVATPTISPAGRPLEADKEYEMITLSCATSDAVLYYTLDGSEPITSGDTTSAVYSASFQVKAGDSVRAVALKRGYADSVATESIEFPVKTRLTPPTITPNGEIFTYGTTVAVTLIHETLETALYYTLDGSDPANSDTRTLYNISFGIEISNLLVTLRVIGVKEGFLDSEIVEASFQSLIETVPVELGSFTMGALDLPEAAPLHNVTLTQTIYISPREVTQKQWKSVMGSLPQELLTGSYGIGDDYPIYFVSWYDAIEFCNKLSEKEGLDPYYTIDKTTSDTNEADADSLKWTITPNNTNGYRLPTEAEWEYAARGGTNEADPSFLYSGSNTIGNVAWSSINGMNTTHPVGELSENALGLYDMSGNVREWCWDWYGAYSEGDQEDPTGAATGTGRVIRGGSYLYNTDYCKVAFRAGDDIPSVKLHNLGFRIVRTFLP